MRSVKWAVLGLALPLPGGRSSGAAVAILHPDITR